MCTSPIYIENKNFFSSSYHKERLSKKFPWKDYTSKTLKVKCGHCRECIRQRQDALVQRIQLESLKNHFFMCTLTYQNSELPVYQVGDYSIRYADYKDVKYCLNRLRLKNSFGLPFRTLTVSELGSKRGRPHFHILFMFPKFYFSENKEDYIQECDSFASNSQHYFTVLNEWRRNYGSRKFPDWHNLTVYTERFINGSLKKNYDFHYVNPFLTSNGVEDCGYYVLKYMFKPSDRAVKLQQALRLNLSPEEYDKVWNKVRPRYVVPIGFGLNSEVDIKRKVNNPDSDLLSKLSKDLDYSKQNLDYPAYFNPFTGKQQLFSNYYLDKPDIYGYDDRLLFWHKKQDASPGDIHIELESQIKTKTDYQIDEARYEKTIQHCDDLGFDADLDLLD